MKKTNDRPIKDVLHELINAYKLNGKLNEARVVSSWNAVMGKTIAKHTTKIFVKNRKLFIAINSAPLKQEMFYAKEKIVQLMNKELGEAFIKDVVFQ